MKMRRLLVSLLVLAMVLTLFPVSALAVSTFSDTDGHWAREAIETWSGLGIIQGYDGKFRPDDPITRGDMAVIIDRIMKYQTSAGNSFTDLGQAYYTEAILKANAAGVIQGSGSLVRPNDVITREEAAVMLGRALGLDESSAPTGFSDSGSISSWALGYVSAMAGRGFIHGSGNMFNPQRPIKRAEIVTILDNAISAIYAAPAEYTDDVSGIAIVNSPDVVLKDMTINGDLIISEGVGNGDVTLLNVTVTGDTIIRGGGADSIHILGNSNIAGIIIDKTDDGKIRIVTEDGAVVDAVYIDDGSDDIILTGSFESVTVAADVNIVVVGASIGSLAVEEAGASVNIDKNSTIDTLNVKVPASIYNSGTIDKAVISANNVIIDGEAPDDLEVGDDVTSPPTNSSGKPVEESPTPPSGGGGGFSGPSKVSVSGVSVTGNAVVGQTLEAAPAPSGATVTYQWKICGTADGTYENITGEASSTYTLAAGDFGKYIKVTATGTGDYTGAVTSAAKGPIKKEITSYTPLADVNLTADEHLVNLAVLKAGGKLPTEVTVTDGITPVEAAITDWTGSYDGTVNTHTLTAVWTMPDGYADTADPISVTVNVVVTAGQTKSVESIAVKTQPTKLSYVEGDTLDLTGLAVTLTYNDESTEDVAHASFSAKGITASPAAGTSLTVDAHNGQPVVISCNEKTVNTDNLTVTLKEVTRADGDVTQDGGYTGGVGLTYDFDASTKKLTIDADGGFLPYYPQAGATPPSGANWVGVAIPVPAGVDTNEVSSTIGGTTCTDLYFADGKYMEYINVRSDDLTDGAATYIWVIKWGSGYADETITINLVKVGGLEAPPELKSVSPEEESINLAYDESFKLIVTASGTNLYELEVDHSLEGDLPEFSVYASETNPYGTDEDKTAFESYGVV
ncbi:MAG: S-layer homology domain-containing protein, partial [Oscillospiraceae bacterium]